MLLRKFVSILFIGLVCPIAAWGAQNVLDDDTGSKILDTLYVSDRDVRLYKNIFRDIKNEDIKSAQQRLKSVENDILLGHVKAQIYLSKSYKSSPEELKNWLKKYSDLPQARSIYNLAVSKAGKSNVDNPWGEKYPKIYSPYSWFSNQYEDYSDKERAYLRAQVGKFRKLINKGQTKAAKTMLDDKKFRQTIPDKEYDAMSVTLATVYLLDNQNNLAWDRVQKAVRRSHNAMGYWIGGLAAWKMKQYKNAASFFAQLGAKYQENEWLVAAGAYWAYRSYSRMGKKSEAEKWLNTAAIYKRTFYGMLATYKLGLSWRYNWEGSAFFNDYSSDEYVRQMLDSSAIRRALVLLKAKNPELAEKEIRAAYQNMNKQQKEALLFIAQNYQMHALAILLANDIKDNENGLFYDEAAYPVPQWEPRGGWKISQALVWALVRQESAFKPQAQSGAGAKGLMQLMPATAVHITKNPQLKKNNDVLYQKDYNLSLGQRYVNYLAEKSFINGNMFYLIAAYNAGPGNLFKWQKKVKYDNDPLLFIEVIPSRETRIYIERVMANYWMYEARFGLPHPSMEALSDNRWPTLQ